MRRAWRFVALSLAFFLLPALVLGYSAYQDDTFVYSLMPASEVRNMEKMYSNQKLIEQGRGTQGDAAEDLGALLGDEAVRVPQGLDGGPGAQVAALQAGDDAAPAVRPPRPPGRQDEGPGGRPGGPVDEGVAPVGRVVAVGGAEGVLVVYLSTEP